MAANLTHNNIAIKTNCILNHIKKMNLKIVMSAMMAASILSSCGLKTENEKLAAQNDSLQVQLQSTLLAVNTLQQVAAWMDSIDSGRQNLELGLEMGISSDDFVARMEAINRYVKDSEKKITDLESELGKASSQSQAYSGTISRLRRQLEEKSNEVAGLQMQVSKYRAENQDLISSVSMKEEEIKTKDSELEIKRQELQLLENRIQAIMKQSQMSEAEALFARGEALEEAARRTRLAPKKRRETFLEALDMYRQSKNLGYEGADAKIEELQKLLNMN
jgi:chromosome segregation ATPase